MSFVIDHEFEIAAPAEIVWEVLTDFQRYGEWNPFCVECATTLTPGDPIRMQVNLTGKPQRVEEVIESCTPGQGFAYHMKPIPLGALSSQRTHRIEPVTATTSRYYSHFELKGWLKPLVVAIFGKGMRAGFGGMSEGVKQRAEATWRQRQKKTA
jgi:uncharacterized protein YndB with AHSA1/START domain